MSTLRFFRWTYPQHTGSGFTIVPNVSNTNPNIEQYCLQLVTKLKNFDVIINHNLPHLLHGHLREWIHKMQIQQLRVIYKYLNEIERYLILLNNAPNGSLNQRKRDQVQLELDNVTNDLMHTLADLQTKARFINDLDGQNFVYYNAGASNLKQTDDVEMLERMLIKDNKNDRILCSNDILNSNNQSKLKILLHKLVEKRKANPKLHLIYADFSYSSFKLFDMIMLPLKRNINKQQTLSLPSTERQEVASSSLANNDVINILLLGETGVGKSTFINAFVNYLTFDTLQQAQSNKPVVVIPVSFLITTGDNFDEHTVKFGDSDALNNEDFNHPGQSVTQQCRSYIFNLDDNDKRKVRIIDTPGFGDTRGIDQDDINMKHILEYISDLTHLDAVCFLLKPNVSRLNISFETCLTQLLHLLGPNARENIIFCFTNARATFYSPGNTTPLLRTMLNSLPINDIPFKKANTFCFDSESFRYLVALQDGIQFIDEEKQEYEISWSTSVNESNRLLTYIRTQLSSYHLHNNWQSIEHAQIEINQLVRPMLEAMRNILRNLILWEVNPSNRLIKLCPQAIQHSRAFCASCKRDAFQLAGFWILPDDPHEFQEKCSICSCDLTQHNLIDYIISYDTTNPLTNDQQNKMRNIFDELCATSMEFGYFLINAVHSTKDDPFRIGLIHMILEEKQICTDQESNQLNIRLVEYLEKLLMTYEEQMKKTHVNPKNRNLQYIYERIKTTREYSIVHEQMAAIYQHRDKYKDKQQEFEISKNSIRHKTYLSTEC